MDDVFGVGGSERCSHLANDRNHCRTERSLSLVTSAQRFTIEEFHDDERRSVLCVPTLIDIHQAWMANQIGCTRFVKKARHLFFVVGVLGQKDFDRGATTNLRIQSLIDRAHTAFTELADDLIGLDFLRMSITHQQDLGGRKGEGGGDYFAS